MLQVGVSCQGVFVLEHPLAELRTLFAGLHFIGKYACVASAARQVGDDGAQ